MRWLLLFLLLPCMAQTQSRTVLPEELGLEVIITQAPSEIYLGEMVLITIRGAYRRHITLEKLEQPDFAGFNWSQLGPDRWSDQRIDGRKVKILERRMAIYPKRTGPLTIGPFIHHLTLTDEGDDWFEYDIRSEPVSINVAPIPTEAEGQWWFPTKSLRVSDQWSNAPDQLKKGDGVLRVIHIQATGVTPEMIPPMPELKSPSAMIFAHPEKRLVELSPNGPITHAFWRWTLRPTNDHSAILEPVSVPYFDTTTRRFHTAVITAQRVAYTPTEAPKPVRETQAHAPLPGWPMAAFSALCLAAMVGFLMRGRRLSGQTSFQWPLICSPLYWTLRRAFMRGDVHAARSATHALVQHRGSTSVRTRSLAELDALIFDPNADKKKDLRPMLRAILAPETDPDKTPLQQT